MKNSQKQLIIVESPTKATLIQKLLRNSYKVLSCHGHVRDLPENRFGIDLKSFEPEYVILPKAEKILSYLKENVKTAKIIYLATDPDREGEAIAWHLKEILKLKNNYKRIVFHEISERAIKEALKNPTSINMNLVLAQKARRVLDRIIGYKVSPFLWENIAPKLSAGRVQSVALRLIVEREKEIENFIPQEYWKIIAKFKKHNICFKAELKKINDKNINKFSISKSLAEKIVNELKNEIFVITDIKAKEVKQNPPPPLITSSLQRLAYKKLKLSAKETMKIAQKLYETGYITYIRTDSTHISEHALASAKDFITKHYGENYCNITKYKTKSKLAQEAHEAIRPVDVFKTPDKVSSSLSSKETELYKLIWQIFIASQMTPAIINHTTIEITAKNYTFQAKGETLKFDGFMKVYKMKLGDLDLPELEKGEILKPILIEPQQHFTQPPPRYDEATLIKELERNGVGRPSTYATIVSVIKERGYVEENKDGKLIPTSLGIGVSEILKDYFDSIFEVGFTAKMEEDLDKIAKGEIDYLRVVKTLYISLEKILTSLNS